MKRGSANTQLRKADQLHLIRDLRVVAARCLRDEEHTERVKRRLLTPVNTTDLAIQPKFNQFGLCTGTNMAENREISSSWFNHTENTQYNLILEQKNLLKGLSTVASFPGAVFMLALASMVGLHANGTCHTSKS